MSEQSNEYSVEWFRWMSINNPKWLGTQALRLWEHYAALEVKRDELKAKLEAFQKREVLPAVFDVSVIQPPETGSGSY